MIFRSCLLLSAVACYTSTALNVKAAVGERVTLDLGAGDDGWRRERVRGLVEFIKRCGPGETGPHCTNFVLPVPYERRVAEPRSDAYVTESGALVIRSMKATDVGLYHTGQPRGNAPEDVFSYFRNRPWLSLQLKD
ncbi:unnamed protein product [Heligmosomoides polygyrus]|uniref:Secreted protein n=1 Tax=Heligmosomoides polygyrus TaxID=6339 RepID=A0A183GHI1_HELPZ|nr:unnamed protein product [Heligmosomoides polygyrus]